MIKRLLRFLCKKPIYLDALVLILLLIFSHVIVSFHRREAIGELMRMPQYWIAFAFTLFCALVVVTYIKVNNYYFSRQNGIHDSILARVEKQLRWNLLPPVIFVILAVGVYFAMTKTSIFNRGYFGNEFIFVVVGIFSLLLLYSGFEVLQYLVNAADERRAFEVFKAKVLSEEPIGPSGIDAAGEQKWVAVSHYALNQLLRLPLNSVGVIERRNNKNTLYTYDGEKYWLPMVKEEVLAFSESHGFTWLSPYYGIHVDAIDYLSTGDHGNLLIALKEGIKPVLQQQIVCQEGSDDNQQRYFIKIHKNKAREIREWYKNAQTGKGRPNSERP